MRVVSRSLRVVAATTALGAGLALPVAAQAKSHDMSHHPSMKHKNKMHHSMKHSMKK